jgi:hypothetical protein
MPYKITFKEYAEDASEMWARGQKARAEEEAREAADHEGWHERIWSKRNLGADGSLQTPPPDVEGVPMRDRYDRLLWWFVVHTPSRWTYFKSLIYRILEWRGDPA